MTTDLERLANALKTSKKLDVSADGKSVTRKGNPPLPEVGKSGKRKDKEEEDKETSEFLKDQDLISPYSLLNN